MFYSGYRFYDVSLDRWANKDPLDELGFELLRQFDVVTRTRFGLDPQTETPDVAGNLYCYVENTPIYEIDPVGLFLGFGYGNSCGWSRSGPGGPIDEVDAACEKCQFAGKVTHPFAG